MTLYEREAIGAGASGRNSGIVQHPMDPALVPLYEDSLALYAALGHGFSLPAEPTGVLIVAEEGPALAAAHEATARPLPRALARVARGRGAARGRARAGVRPVRVPGRRRAADRADRGDPRVGERARAAGAGSSWASRPCSRCTTARRRCAGGRDVARRRRGGGGRRAVDAGGGRRRAAVAARAGQLGRRGAGAPAPATVHALEQAGVEALTEPGGAPPSLFSLVTTGEVSAVGSTFTATSRTPRRWRRACWNAARATCRRWPARRSSTCAPARGRWRRRSPAARRGAGSRRPVPGHRPRRVGRHARAGFGTAGGAVVLGAGDDIPPELQAAASARRKDYSSSSSRGLSAMTSRSAPVP